MITYCTQNKILAPPNGIPGPACPGPCLLKSHLLPLFSSLSISHNYLIVWFILILTCTEHLVYLGFSVTLHISPLLHSIMYHIHLVSSFLLECSLPVSFFALSLKCCSQGVLALPFKLYIP